MSTETTPSAPPGDVATSPPHAFVKHTTTNPAPVHPFIDTSLPSINSGAPVELDSTPVSPVARKDSWKVHSAGTGTVTSGDDKAYQELDEESGVSESEKQKREELLQERQKDPSVLVDIPNTPGPEEYGIAQAGLGAGVARRSSVAGVTPREVAATVEQSPKS